MSDLIRAASLAFQLWMRAHLPTEPLQCGYLDDECDTSDPAPGLDAPLDTADCGP